MTNAQNQQTAQNQQPQHMNPIDITNAVAGLMGTVRALVQNAEADTAINGMPAAPGLGAVRKQAVLSVLEAAFVDHAQAFDDMRPAIEVYIDHHVSFMNLSGRFRRSPPPQVSDVPARARPSRSARPPAVATNGGEA